MPKFTAKRITLGIVAGLLVAGVVLVAARTRLLAVTLDRALRARGADEVHFSIAAAGPWRIEIANLAFRLAARQFSAERIILAREHWWTPSLGTLQVEKARVPVPLRAESTAATATPPSATPAPAVPDVPLESISFDGEVVLGAGAPGTRELRLRATAERTPAGDWQARGEVTAPGLRADLAAEYAKAPAALNVRASALHAEVAPLVTWINEITPLPSGTWETSGVIDGELKWSWTGDASAASGRFQLRDGRVANTGLNLTAAGVEADVDFTDLALVVTQPSPLRIRTLSIGRVTFTDVAAEVVLHGTDEVDVRTFHASALGGRVGTEPFRLKPSTGEIDAVVLADGLDAAQILALTQDLPAQAAGRVSGRVPLHYGANGLRFSTGWLGLQSGVAAEVQFQAAGLLTAGAAPGSAGFAVLQKIESGLLRLKVTELRLDIRPPNAPPGRTAQLHLKGEPVDPTVKAPVTLDLNVNGPVEALLNLGLKGGVSVGTKP